MSHFLSEAKPSVAWAFTRHCHSSTCSLVFGVWPRTMVNIFTGFLNIWSGWILYTVSIQSLACIIYDPSSNICRYDSRKISHEIRNHCQTRSRYLNFLYSVCTNAVSSTSFRILAFLVTLSISCLIYFSLCSLLGPTCLMLEDSVWIGISGMWIRKWKFILNETFFRTNLIQTPACNASVSCGVPSPYIQWGDIIPQMLTVQWYLECGV